MRKLPHITCYIRAGSTWVVKGTLTLENVLGHSYLGRRSLALHYRGVTRGGVARTSTPTFTPPEAVDMPGYNPPGQCTISRLWQ